MGRELCSKNSWKGNSGEKMSDQFRRRRPISRLTNQYELPGQRKPQTAKMEGEDKIFESLKRSQFDRVSIKNEDMYVVQKNLIVTLFPEWEVLRQSSRNIYNMATSLQQCRWIPLWFVTICIRKWEYDCPYICLGPNLPWRKSTQTIHLIPFHDSPHRGCIVGSFARIT